MLISLYDSVLLAANNLLLSITDDI